MKLSSIAAAAANRAIGTGNGIDQVTGLPALPMLAAHLAQLDSEGRAGLIRGFAVICVNVDRFDRINQSIGYAAGDELLRSAAARVRAVLGEQESVFRFHGDELVVVARGTTDVRLAIAAAERIRRIFEEPFGIAGTEIFASASIGLALWNPAYENLDDLLRDAAVAVHVAKEHGRNRSVMFETAMHARMAAALTLENDLRAALARGELRTYYQPIVTVGSDQITGFEALVRWQHPESGLLSPGEFIGVAEQSGLVIQIDRWVAEEACRQLRAWQVRLRPDPPLTISVNISSPQFLQPDLISQIDHILRKTGLYGRSLKLELTESILMENAEYTSAMLQQLRTLDIGISIDDFGTGYSSLSYLRRFAVDTLKIDRSFVSKILDDEESAAIVKTIVNLAHNLGKETVAEGVENASILTKLRLIGADHVQGYHISPPVPAEQAEEMLERTRSAPDHLKEIIAYRTDKTRT